MTIKNSKYTKCTHGGGSLCANQGGDGSVVHGPNYMHKYSHYRELHGMEPPEGTLSPVLLTLSKSLDYMVEDEDLALNILSTAEEVMSKALYHFDFNKNEGIERVLELLPVLDEEVVKDIYATVFPSYPVDDNPLFNLRMARLELRGFFMDFLANYGDENDTEATTTNILENVDGIEAANSSVINQTGSTNQANEAAA